MWRFKTKEEFESEFDRGWRGKVEPFWNRSMDHLLELPIDIKDVVTISEKGYLRKKWLPEDDMLWNIGRNHITHGPLPEAKLTETVFIDGSDGVTVARIANSSVYTVKGNFNPTQQDVKPTSKPIEILQSDFQIPRGNKLSGKPICY